MWANDRSLRRIGAVQRENWQYFVQALHLNEFTQTRNEPGNNFKTYNGKLADGTSVTLQVEHYQAVKYVYVDGRFPGKVRIKEVILDVNQKPPPPKQEQINLSHRQGGGRRHGYRELSW